MINYDSHSLLSPVVHNAARSTEDLSCSMYNTGVILEGVSEALDSVMQRTTDGTNAAARRASSMVSVAIERMQQHREFADAIQRKLDGEAEPDAVLPAVVLAAMRNSDSDEADSTILDAFATVRRCGAEIHSTPPIGQDKYNELDALKEVAEKAIERGTAKTIAGVIARLTLLVPALDNSRWVEAALMQDVPIRLSAEAVLAQGMLSEDAKIDGHAEQLLLAIVELSNIAKG